MFKKLALAAVSAAALSAAPANAAITFTGTVPSGIFFSGVIGSGPFTETGTFITPAGYNLVSASITTTFLSSNPLTNIDFTPGGVTLNGSTFNMDPIGITEQGVLNGLPLIAGGTNTLSVSGTSTGAATFSGTLVFAQVPEPATWLMMMAGFGALGFALRRQKAATRRVNFNFA